MYKYALFPFGPFNFFLYRHLQAFAEQAAASSPRTYGGKAYGGKAEQEDGAAPWPGLSFRLHFVFLVFCLRWSDGDRHDRLFTVF